MSTQDRIVRLSAATMVITGLIFVGVVNGSFLISWLDDSIHEMSFLGSRTRAETTFTPAPDSSDLTMQSVEMMAPDAPTGRLFDQFDKIVVDVERDGGILVFGESMEVSKFRAMLLDQLTDHAKTIVTIRPDDDCLFRHIEQVIQVCNECEIHHQTVPNSETAVPTATLSHSPS